MGSSLGHTCLCMVNCSFNGAGSYSINQSKTIKSQKFSKSELAFGYKIR